MGSLFDRLRAAGGQESLFSPVGRWRFEVSQSLESLRVGNEYLTQPMWFVNSTTGNDSNDGATEGQALKTPQGLLRHFYGRIVPQDTTVQYRGSFSSLSCLLDCVVLPGVTLTLRGDAPIVAYLGTISSYQSMAASISRDIRITDTNRNFSSDVNRRLRITGGANADTLFWVAKDLGANTARTSQPMQPLVNGTLGATTPVVGDPYVIETLTTSFDGCYLNVRGGGEFIVRDIAFSPSSFKTNWAWSDGILQAFFVGCVLDAGVGLTLSGNPFLKSCRIKDAPTIQGPVVCVQHGGLYHGAVGPTLLGGGFMLIQGNPIFQGLGSFPFSATRGFTVLFSGTGFSDGGPAFLDCVDTDSIVGISRSSSCDIRSNAVLWGSNNTAPVGLHAFTNSRFTYDSLVPTITGNVGGQDVSVGGTLTTWAAISAAGGVLNSKNGACVAPRA